MNIRKYEAESLREAMQQAKLELGDDAMILNTRQVPPTPAEILARPKFELVAASGESDDDVPSSFVPESRPYLESGTEVSMLQELSSLRKTIESLVGEGVLRAHDKPPAGAEKMLRDAGVDPPLAIKIAQSLFDLPTVPALAERWSQLFRCLPPTLDQPQTIAVVGPTGCGKTTAIAGLAAMCKYSLGADVTIISTDTLRIGAFGQMEKTADLLGVDFRLCADCGAVRSALDELTPKSHIVLIDTRSGAPSDSGFLTELAALVSDPRIAVHLAIPASLAPGARKQTLEAFDKAVPQRLMITKLDEAPDAAYLLGLSQATPLPISLVTSDQELTSGVDPADSVTLATMLVNDLLSAESAG